MFKIRTAIWIAALLLLFSIVSFSMGISILLIITLDLFCISLLYVCKDVHKNLLYLFFLISFFTYLIGGHICYEYFGMEIKYYFGDEYYAHSNICIILALVALLCGYFVLQHAKLKGRNDGNKQYAKNRNEMKLPKMKGGIREASKYLFWLSYPFWIIEGLYEAVSASGGNYYNTYIEGSGAPFLIRAAAALTPYFFYVFVATFPKKKECRISLILYVCYAILSLFSGQRRTFVNMLLFVALYYIFRNKRDGEEKWIEKKHIVFAVILLPVIMVVTYLWSFFRLGESYEESKGLVSLLLSFFQQQGFSSSVIRLEKFYEDSLNNDVLYSFYSVVKNFRQNTLIKLLFNPQYGYTYTHSVEFATLGNSLDNALSYIVLRNYSQGAGVGSCYLAELYHDFGYVGVFLGNVIYGFVIQFIQKVWNFASRYKVWFVAIGFSMVDALLKAPRWNFDLIISYPLDFGMWVSFALIVIASGIIRRKKTKKKSRGIRI